MLASPTRFEPPGIDPTRAPATMTRDQRRQEIAAILARGVLRLRRNARNGPVSCPDCPPEELSEFRREALEVGQGTSLHVTA